jgi:hypothetical protein
MVGGAKKAKDQNQGQAKDVELFHKIVWLSLELKWLK